MTTTSTRRPVGHAGRDVLYAWLSVLLLPIVLALAFLIGEGLIELLGFPTGQTVDPPPLWAILVATVPALLVFCVPALVSSWFARRAASQGDRRGWVPAILLAVAALAFIATNVFAGLAQLG